MQNLRYIRLISFSILFLLFSCDYRSPIEPESETDYSVDIPRREVGNSTEVKPLEAIDAPEDMPPIPLGAVFKATSELGVDARQQGILALNNAVVDNAVFELVEVLDALRGQFRLIREVGAISRVAEGELRGQPIEFLQRFDGVSIEVEITKNGAPIFSEETDFRERIFTATIRSTVDNGTPVSVTIDVVDNVFRRVIFTDFNNNNANQYTFELRTDPRTFTDLQLVRLEQQ